MQPERREKTVESLSEFLAERSLPAVVERKELDGLIAESCIRTSIGSYIRQPWDKVPISSLIGSKLRRRGREVLSMA